MSFSSEIKEELTKVVIKEESAKLAELAGFMITNCVVTNEKEEFLLKMSSENPAIIKRMYHFFQSIYQIEAITNLESNEDWTIGKVSPMYKESVYLLKIVDKLDLEKVFKNHFVNINVCMQIVLEDKEAIKQEDKMVKAFLRGVFLGTGSVVNPQTRYHLEMIANNQDNALFIHLLLQTLQIGSKIIKRKKDFVIYVKGAESISNFLAAIGANKGMLTFEETRVFKEMRNNINRINNFDNANFDKTVDASLLQVEDIAVIKRNRKFEKMPEPLKQLARLRLSYREATFDELGKMLEPSLSRAGVCHRFKKIKEIADSLRAKEQSKVEGTEKK